MAQEVLTGIIVDQGELIAGIKEYLLTPESLSGGVVNFKRLAEFHGTTEVEIQRCMAQNPEIGSEILQMVAVHGAMAIPRVLTKLLEAVEHGSVKAAEIYLDFHRKTIQDPAIARMAQKASQDLSGVMENVGSQIEMLLGAAAQPDAEAARRFLSGPVSRTSSGFSSRAAIALESDGNIPKAENIEGQT